MREMPCIQFIRYYANVMLILLLLTFCIAISSEILLAHYSVENQLNVKKNGGIFLRN